MFAISRQFEASVLISKYCTQPSLPKNRRGSNTSIIKDAAVLSGWDGDENEAEEKDKDNNEYSRNDFVVDDGAEEEEDKTYMPSRLISDNLEDSDENKNGDESKGSKRQRLQCIG